MSEQLEQWKACDRIRSSIGWAAIFVGLGGAVVLAVSIAGLALILTFRVTGTPINAPVGVGVGLALGVGLLVCGRGLWNARSWARWVSLLLYALFLVQELFSLVQERTLSIGLPFSLFVVVFLLLPSTSADFARAAGRTTT